MLRSHVDRRPEWDYEDRQGRAVIHGKIWMKVASGSLRVCLPVVARGVDHGEVVFVGYFFDDAGVEPALDRAGIAQPRGYTLRPRDACSLARIESL